VNTPAVQGVVPGYTNQLTVSGSVSPLTVATGAAVVNGIPYENDVAFSLTVPTPAVGTTGKRVVLRADYTARTVRIVLLTSADGVSAFPALVQTGPPSGMWDISLATLSVTTGGGITVTDTRQFVHFNTMVSGSMLDADSVDDTKAGNRVPQFYRRQGGDATNWATPGTTDYTPGVVRMQAGIVTIPAVGTASATYALTFPVPFSAPPLVFVTTELGQSAAMVQATSATGCTLLVENTAGTTFLANQPVHWLAIGAE
jgi:hypothetical protein